MSPSRASACRRHGTLGLGQVLARLRHHLRRGSAEVHGVAVGLRPPVPRPTQEARCRRHRRAPPTIAIEQRSSGHNPRSTVATSTEIYDYLRLLFARTGTPTCWIPTKTKKDGTIVERCGTTIAASNPSQITDAVTAMPEGTRLMVIAHRPEQEGLPQGSRRCDGQAGLHPRPRQRHRHRPPRDDQG